MDAAQITQIIGTVGFPIAAYLLMYWDLRNIIKENTKVLIELKEIINAKKES